MTNKLLFHKQSK